MGETALQMSGVESPCWYCITAPCPRHDNTCEDGLKQALHVNNFINHCNVSAALTEACWPRACQDHLHTVGEQ